MNPDIYATIEDMKKRSPKNPIANSDIQTYLSVETSRPSRGRDGNSKQQNRGTDRQIAALYKSNDLPYLDAALCRTCPNCYDDSEDLKCLLPL